MSKHTPGPWVYLEDLQDIQDGSGKMLAEVTTLDGPYGERPEITDANGYLIAAAPDLLEACKDAQRMLEEVHGLTKSHTHEAVSKVITEIRTAIAEAQGDWSAW